MNRSVRPKSAKGKTRSNRTNYDNSTSASHVLSASRGLVSTSSSSSQSRNATITSTFASSSQNIIPESNGNGSSAIGSFPQITRPTSSLSRYRILPSISSTDLSTGDDTWFDDVAGNIDGRVSEMELLTEQAQQMILDSSIQNYLKRPSPPASAQKRKVAKTVAGTERKRLKMYQTRSIFSNSRTMITKEPAKPKVPKEPGVGENRILIALKLPDGTRVERFFNPRTKLVGVLAYAQSQYPVLPLNQCNLFRMDTIPKKLLQNTELSLQDVGIENRTVLYVEEKEDDD